MAKTAHRGQEHVDPSLPFVGINTYNDLPPFTGVFPKTDCSYSIDQLQAAFPACTTVGGRLRLVRQQHNPTSSAGFIHPRPHTSIPARSSTPRPGCHGRRLSKMEWVDMGTRLIIGNAHRASTEMSSGLIPISSPGGSFTYGGTPCDQSIVECIVDLKSRGLRVVFYPFILMDDGGKSWRGRITYSPDVSSAATSAVNGFPRCRRDIAIHERQCQ